jgi:hypothetical protein
MATQGQLSNGYPAQQMSEPNRFLRRFRTAMESHQIDLRLSINHIETIVGCIAKSPDKQVTEHLPQCNLAISNLRECLSSLQVQWLMFDGWQTRHNQPEDRPD